MYNCEKSIYDSCDTDPICFCGKKMEIEKSRFVFRPLAGDKVVTGFLFNCSEGGQNFPVRLDAIPSQHPPTPGRSFY